MQPRTEIVQACTGIANEAVSYDGKAGAFSLRLGMRRIVVSGHEGARLGGWSTAVPRWSANFYDRWCPLKWS